MQFNLAFASRTVEDYQVVAVAGLVSPENQPDHYVMIRNARGWDIPGGRVEANETPVDAFTRELMEESGYQTIGTVATLALLEIVENPDLAVIIYAAAGKQAGKPTAKAGEILDCQLMDAEDVIAHYFGDKDKMRQLISLANQQTK